MTNLLISNHAHKTLDTPEEHESDTSDKLKYSERWFHKILLCCRCVTKQ